MNITDQQKCRHRYVLVVIINTTPSWDTASAHTQQQSERRKSETTKPLTTCNQSINE